jgi:hypothetical protein
MKRGFHLWKLKPRSSQSSGCTHIHQTSRRSLNKRLPESNCFLGQERNADGGIHATRDHSNVRSLLRNNEKLCRAIQNKRHGMLTTSVVLLHDNAHPYTAAHTQALLKHFKWEFFDHPLYSPDLTPSNYHLFTYLRKWLRSQRFNNNELM